MADSKTVMMTPTGIATLMGKKMTVSPAAGQEVAATWLVPSSLDSLKSSTANVLQRLPYLA